jgi:hypothetical protein
VIQLGIQLDATQIARAQAMLREVPGGIKRAVARAGNETFAEAKTQIVKLVRQHINILAKDVSSHINMQHRMKWVAGTIQGKLVIPWGERLGLKYFGAKQTKKGVTYLIKKGGGRKLLPGAFIGTQRLGEQVWMRAGLRKRPRVKKIIQHPKAGRKKNRKYAWPDLPIYKRMGASIWGVMIKNDLLEPVRQSMQMNFHKNLIQRVDAELLRHAGKIPPAKQAA